MELFAEKYNKIPNYNDVELTFTEDGQTVGTIKMTTHNCETFERVKIGIERVIEDASQEQRYGELKKKKQNMEELQDFFNNLSEKDQKIMEKFA